MGGGPTSAKEKILIILPQPEPKDILERLRARYPDTEVTYYAKAFDKADRSVPDTVLPNGLYDDKTILFTSRSLPETKDQAPNLKLVHLYSAGAESIIKHPLFTDTEIPFTNCSGVHGPQITEWVIFTALVNRHKYNSLYENQKLRQWDRAVGWNQVKDLVGEKIGVLGYGAIGRQVARVASALGMDVLAYTATKKDTPESRKDTGYIVAGTGDPDGTIPSAWFSGLDKASLHNFLSQKFSILVISVPLTDDTRHFLSKAEFDILGQHPPLISNIARGAIIDQPALVAALHDGRVAAAALDVTDPEPLPPSDPLWTAPNVIITPHISGASTNYNKRAFEVLEQNLENLANGEKLINTISRRKGY